MSAPTLIATLPQPPGAPPPAAVQLIRAGLEALSARLGQTLPATVLGTDANGLTQLKLGDVVIAVKLSQPLPPGTQLQLAVQPTATGTPTLVVQPAAVPVMPAPALPTPLPAALPMTPLPAVPSGGATSGQAVVTPAVATQAVVATPGAAPAVLAATTATAATATATPSPAPPHPAPAATVAPSPVAPAAGTTSATASVASPPVAAGTPTPAAAMPAVPSVVATPSAAALPPTPAPASGTSAPATVTGAAVPSAAQAATGTSPSAQPAAPAPLGAAPTAAAPPATSPATAGAVPMATAAAQPSPQPAAAATQAAVSSPQATVPAPIASTSTAPTAIAAAPPVQAQVQVPVQAPTAASPYAVTTAASTAAAMSPAAVATSSPAPRPGLATPPTPAAPATPRATALASLPLAQPAQAAARQDSIAPLLQNLGALQGKLATFPQPVAEAAMRLLAARLPLDRGAPSAQMLKAAVEGAGVLVSPARAMAGGDVRSALMQLRAGLLGLLGNGEIAPVAAVTRRPPPPLRDAQPRAVRAEAPTLADGASGRDTARALLHQTDAALSRLKLTQLASQPADAARAAAAAPDFMVELPVVLGHELSLAQLRVQRDGKARGRAQERGWRVRFAISFSEIGEVGAQVSLMGRNANVVIWAAEPRTADALEEMLPELTPALAARGLDVGAVRVRRGVPPDEEPAAAGRLMDRRG
jgi:hypothetical protein